MTHTPATPRHPRMFAGVAGRAARALTTAASALALAVGALALAPAPAHAADPITNQEYFSYYHLDAARQKGYTGKGVTIALIDGPVDTNVAELTGANITDKSRCTIEASPEGVRHGTDMATILVSPYTGVAPDATLLTYQLSNASSRSAGNCALGGEKQDTFGKLINQAIEDGAQIISVSQGASDQSDEVKWAIANATSRGVIIVASAGNNSKDDNSTHLSRWSGVVGVSAINLDGSFALDYSSFGDSVTTAAFGGPIKARDYDTGQIRDTSGTSIATPIVAASLALARQKWPDATSNQLLQLLIHTGSNPQHAWNNRTGYGAVNPGALINTDPSQYPDENPVSQKADDAYPTAEMIRDYGDGRADAPLGKYDDTYVYRGTDDIYIHADFLAQTPHLGTSPAYHRK